MPEMDFVVSSNIEAIGYDDDAREIHVRFVKSGQTYVYMDVPPEIYEEFRICDSKGTYVNQILKGAYTFRKL